MTQLSEDLALLFRVTDYGARPARRRGKFVADGGIVIDGYAEAALTGRVSDTTMAIRLRHLEPLTTGAMELFHAAIAAQRLAEPEGGSLAMATGRDLDRLCENYMIRRAIGETDESLRERARTYLTKWGPR